MRNLLWRILVLWLLASAPAGALPLAADVQLAPLSGVAWRQAEGGLYARGAEPLPPSFTLQTVVTVGENVDGLPPVYLAGAGPGAKTAPSSLALVWEPVSSGWFEAAWSLRLRSEAGLLPRPAGSEDSAATVDLIRAVPRPGHRYSALLSYDSRSGAVSVQVLDLTDGATVCEGNVQAAPTTEPLYPAYGLGVAGRGDESGLTFESAGWLPLFLPAGTRWATESAPDGSVPVVARRFSPDETVWLHVELPATPPPGSLRVLLADAAGAASPRPLAQLQGVGGQQRVGIPARSLPLGASTLRLEYVVDGRIWLADTRTITVGVANVRLTEVRVERESGRLSGSLQLSAPAALTGLDLAVQAVWREQIWDPAKKDYTSGPALSVPVLVDRFDIPKGTPVTVPYSVALPAKPGFWEITFQVSASPQVDLLLSGERQLVTTYPAAAPNPGEAFTIAVLPDTQYYAQTYPTIFLRQLQWVAEQAAQRNILLTLQLGDITDDNAPYQWERAVQSFKLIEGLMPYMVAQGNHDLATNGAAADRAESLINQYFPVDRLPWIRGTLEPGRIENSYATFRLQDQDYLVISLEFGPRDEALAWANQVVASHPHHRVIFITHSYIGRNGYYTNSALDYPLARNPNTSVNGGEAVWRDFVQRHPNMFLSLSGHIYSRAIPRRVSRGEQGNLVYEMLMDYQGDENGGNGYLVLMTFRPDGTIEVEAYSPYLDQPRTERDAYGFDNHFVIDPAQGRFRPAP